MNKMNLGLVCVMSALTLGLSACGGESQSQSQSQSQNNTNTQATSASNSNSGDKKTYIVGSEMSKFPVVIHDGKGKTEGFEAELLQAIADKQGFKIQYTIDNWGGILKKIENNQADMVIGSVTITDERKKTMDFSEPVLPYKTGAMVVEKLSNLKSFKDLKGKKVNLRKNTVYEALVPIFSNEDGSNMVYPQNVWGQVSSLLAGESEAMIGASITLEYYKKQHPDQKFHIIYEADAPISNYGWAVKKGDTELLNLLNTGLQQAKQDGTYDTIYKKYW